MAAHFGALTFDEPIVVLGMHRLYKVMEAHNLRLLAPNTWMIAEKAFLEKKTIEVVVVVDMMAGMLSVGMGMQLGVVEKFGEE